MLFGLFGLLGAGCAVLFVAFDGCCFCLRILPG